MLQLRLAYKIIAVFILVLTALVFLPAGRHDITPIFAGASTQVNADHPVITFTVDASATTMAAAFAQAGQPYYPQDHIQAFPDLANGIGSVVTVTRAMPITVVDGTKTYQLRTWATTVKDLLTEQNILLGDQDKITPALTATLAPNQTITITRVAITQLTQTGPIAFTVTKQNDNTINKGITKVKLAGVTGVMSYLYQVRRENGVEVARTLLSQNVVSAPVTEIDLIGTKPVITVACAGYDSTVLPAAITSGVDPNLLCKGLMIESNGHANSIGNAAGGPYYGLFQYTQSFWAQASAGAGMAGASWNDASAQIKVTAWALAHGFSSRWFWA